MKKIPYKKIFIAEVAEELKGFLEYCCRKELNPSEFLVVSLQPEVKVLCKEKGIEYVDTLPFFNNESHERVLKKSHALTTLIFETLSLDAEPSIKHVFIDTFIFYSRFYINNFLWIIEVMNGIQKAYKEIDFFVLKRDIKQEPMAGKANPFWIKRDLFVDSLVEKYGKAHRLKVNVINETTPLPSTREKKQGKSRKITNILEALPRKMFQLKLKKMSRFHPVFITVPSYNLDRVCRDIQSKFPGVPAVTALPGPLSARRLVKLFLDELLKRLTGKTVSKQLAAVPVPLFRPTHRAGHVRETMCEKINESYQAFASEYHREFEYEGCSFWEEFNRKVETDLLDVTAGVFEAAEAQRAFLEYLKPKLVVSPVSTAEFQGWAEVSKSLGIPALVIPQKTLVVPSKEMARIEEYYIGRAQVTDAFDFAAAQSPLVTEYLKWSGYKGTIIETGNMIFARIDPGKRKEKRGAFFKSIGANENTRVIVWAPSMKTRRSRRFYVLESIDELTSAMEDVFDVVSRIKDVHLIFRIHPGDAITQDEIHALLPVPMNVSVSDSGTFEEVLAVADLLLSFSSTAVQEALVNYIPILLYDKWNRYNHLDANGVNHSTPTKISPAYYIYKKEDLSSTIQWILNEHAGKAFPPDIFKDYVFIEDNGPHFFDFVGQCLER
jgi:hypothetical protein